MMFNRIINNNEMNKFFIYLQNDKSVKSHYAIQDINDKNEFYILYIDVPEKKYNKIIEFITVGKDNQKEENKRLCNKM